MSAESRRERAEGGLVHYRRPGWRYAGCGRPPLTTPYPDAVTCTACRAAVMRSGNREERYAVAEQGGIPGPTWYRLEAEAARHAAGVGL